MSCVAEMPPEQPRVAQTTSAPDTDASMYSSEDESRRVSSDEDDMTIAIREPPVTDTSFDAAPTGSFNNRPSLVDLESKAAEAEQARTMLAVKLAEVEAKAMAEAEAEIRATAKAMKEQAVAAARRKAEIDAAEAAKAVAEAVVAEKETARKADAEEAARLTAASNRVPVAAPPQAHAQSSSSASEAQAIVDAYLARAAARKTVAVEEPPLNSATDLHTGMSAQNSVIDRVSFSEIPDYGEEYADSMQEDTLRVLSPRIGSSNSLQKKPESTLSPALEQFDSIEVEREPSPSLAPETAETITLTTGARDNSCISLHTASAAVHRSSGNKSQKPEAAAEIAPQSMNLPSPVQSARRKQIREQGVRQDAPVLSDEQEAQVEEEYYEEAAVEDEDDHLHEVLKVRKVQKNLVVTPPSEPAGERRSKRQRFAPLCYWKNEKPVYRRNIGDPVMTLVDVQKVKSPVAPYQRKRKKKTKRLEDRPAPLALLDKA
eukprot:SAG31_NODE_4050_length_3637_cov_1.854155_2_plen_488_part_00